MFVGGYQCIDLHGAELTVGGDGVSVDGVFDIIESTQKPIRLCNFSVGNLVQHAVDVATEIGTNAFILHTGGTYNINVTESNIVTAVAVS